MTAASNYRPWRTALTFFLPVSIGLGFFVAGIGTTMWAPVSSWAAGPFCPGTITDGSDTYTTQSGGSGVHRHVVCVTGTGKDQTRDDITFDGIFLATPLYAALFFIGMLIFAAPRMRRKADARDPWSSVGGFTPRTREGERELMKFAASMMQRGNGGNAAMDQNADDTIAERLAELQQLHASGLISDADFETKKAEILSSL
jgi:Short C-terminal domain